MFKRKKLFLILIVVVSLLLVACNAEEQSSSQEKSDDKVEIVIAGGAVGKELETIKKAARMYENDHSNVDIKVLDTPNLAQDRLDLYLQYLKNKSSEVDLYQIDMTWPGDLAQYFIDLNNNEINQAIEKHFQTVVESNRVNDKLIAIPWFIESSLLYYRSDLLEKYGYEGPPRTWDQLEKMVKKIQKEERDKGNSNFWGYLWQGEAYEGLTSNALEWIASNNGGTIVNSEQEITVNNQQAREMIKEVASWVGRISPHGVTSMTEESTRKMWQSGNAVFMRNLPYVYALASAEDSAVEGKFDVAPLPAGDGDSTSVLGGGSLAVSKYSEHPQVAADVALFMTSPKVQKMRAIEAALNPTIKSLYQDQEVLAAVPFFEKLYNVFITATPRPASVTAPNYNQVSQAFYQAVHSVLTGEKDTATALEKLEEKLKKITAFKTDNP
ncbi:ABC transporter substrate-binding protein [Halanaerobacter jeridensis]|uniref:Trehalose/maltose transport system substrate-binding protein n=1 Tax=Halanaerobacter jeridensis TaxID=706427 RepID=A0A938XS49_9FIRM|nr:ABC transporter substrate-binding protein [Halanaerobacter jeridensis]MBM7555829.1 trehalose/maltose transport system substrate-binding protein [Halanaerobacter jeridensis]